MIYCTLLSQVWSGYPMKTTELSTVEAARWVWNSLWPARRHIKMDILDVAIFDLGPNEVHSVPYIARWLFTAKDGRVRKKKEGTATMAALKQSLLSKALREAPQKRTPSGKSTDDAIRQPFATALLSSGESLPVDDNSWTNLFSGKGQGVEVVAVTALDPGTPSESRRQHCQRLACEYKVKIDSSLDSLSNGKQIFPTKASTKTHIVVSPSLLREGEQHSEEIHDVSSCKFSTLKAETLLVSRANEANREAENNLRRIVRWVENIRHVRVLSMTALFAPFLSSQTGAPRAWLERVVSISMQKNISIHGASSNSWDPTPTAYVLQDAQQFLSSQNDPHLRSSPRTFGQGSEIIETTSNSHSHGGKGDPDHSMRSRSGPASVGKDTGVGEGKAETEAIDDSSSKPEDISMNQVLLGAAEAALSAAQDLPRRNPAASVSDIEKGPLVKMASWRLRVCSTPEVDARNINQEECPGEFCAYQGQSSESSPRQKREIAQVVDNYQEDANWTDVNACPGDKGALLNVKQRALSYSHQRASMQLSVMFKSLATAQMEASGNQNSYWCKSLLVSWRGREKHQAFDLKKLTSSMAHREVLVCQPCYHAYRQLDGLREERSRKSCAFAKSLESVTAVGEDNHYESSACGGGIEASAAKLSVDLAAMLEDAEARCGKLGVRTGIIWRRKLSKSKGKSNNAAVPTVGRIPVRLKSCLDKRKNYSAEAKRRVKSQGDTPNSTRKHHQRRPSAPSRLSPLPNRFRVKKRSSESTICLKSSNKLSNDSGGDLLGQTAWPLCGNPGDVKGTRARGCNGRALIAINHLTENRGPKVSATNVQSGESYLTRGARQSPFEMRDDSPSRMIACERSRMSISAIESMLQGGGESYLPHCTRDLPEATAILGPRVSSAASSDQGNQVGSRLHRWRSKRGHTNGKYSWEGANSRRETLAGGRDQGGDVENGTGGTRDRLQREKGGMESSLRRFLHPWQREVEVERREASRVALYEAQLERERRRRSNAEKAAVPSQDCQRTKMRVAARLGHHRQRARRKSIHTAHRGKPKCTSEEDHLGAHDEGPASSATVRGHFAEEMNDYLRWAQKTLDSVVERLRRRGLLVDRESASARDTQSGPEIKELVDNLTKHLDSFKGNIVAFQTPSIRAIAGSPSAALHSRFEQACDAFECNFHRLIEDLSVRSGMEIRSSSSSPSSGWERQDQKQQCGRQGILPEYPTLEASDFNVSQEGGNISVGMCPSCDLLPIVRRCLDCDRCGANKDSCSRCFAKSHRGTGRKGRKSLCIASVPERGATCLACSDIAASRRCRDCGVDLCAACHFRAHRSPRRQAHITKLLDETAVCMQEVLHHQTAPTNGSEIGKPPDGVMGIGISSDDVSNWEVHTDVPGNGVARSLAGVRKTILPPVVRPIPVASVETDNCSAGTLQESEQNASKEDMRTYTREESDMAPPTVGSTAADLVRDHEERDDEVEARHEQRARGGREPERFRGQEVESCCSSSGQDSEDDGMMWSPLTIAKVEVEAPEQEPCGEPVSPTERVDMNSRRDTLSPSET